MTSVHGRIVGYIAGHQGETSTSIYKGLTDAKICGMTCARTSVADLERMGIIRRETVHNDRGGDRKLVFLCGDVDQ